ncbi:MAG: serine hydrolase domain-containing protein [Chryseotalea sp.]
MKSKKYLLSFIGILVFSGLSYWFWPTDKQTQGVAKSKDLRITKVPKHWKPVIESFDSIMENWTRKNLPPGMAVAIVVDSQIVFLKGYGVKAIGTKDAVNEETVFRLASVSKPFASFLTGILIDQQKVNWHHPVKNYLPEFTTHPQRNADSILLKHVLSHSAGYPYHAYTNMIEEGLPLDTLLLYLSEIPLASKPGQVYSYQNVAFSLIEPVIEKITHQPYEKALQNLVFNSLDMQQASADYMSLLASGNLAQPHVYKKGKLSTTIINETYYNVSPAGGVNASVKDMAKWMIALLGNRPDVISKERIQEMFTPYIEANSRNRNFYKWQRVTKASYGLGWRVLAMERDTILYHGGYVAGYRSEVAIHPTKKMGICVLANAAGDAIDQALPTFFALTDSIKHTHLNLK